MFDRKFIRHTMMIALPIMLQNGITNFVGMLDNIMVGRIGTDPMTGVSIVNSLLFVWNLCVFGGLSGIGIFTAQYCGKGDHEGVRRTFRLEIIVAAILVAAGVIAFSFYGEPLINLYLHEDGGGGSVAATMQEALRYLGVMCIGFLPFALTQVYSTTIRSHGETVAPMAASFLAVGVNLVGNYVLIYGKFGAPALGVVGAAAATVIARFVELIFIVIWAHTHRQAVPFIEGVFRSFYVPRELILACIKKGLPLLLNEALWSGGQATLTQCYSVRGALGGVRVQHLPDDLKCVQHRLHRDGLLDFDHHRAEAGRVGRYEAEGDQGGGLPADAVLGVPVHRLGAASRVGVGHIPEDLQHDGRDPGPRDRAHPHHGGLHAGARVQQRLLFHHTVGRQDVYHVPV